MYCKIYKEISNVTVSVLFIWKKSVTHAEAFCLSQYSAVKYIRSKKVIISSVI